MAGGRPASLQEWQQRGQLCPDRLLADAAFGLAPAGDQAATFWSHKEQYLQLWVVSRVSPVEAWPRSEILGRLSTLPGCSLWAAQRYERSSEPTLALLSLVCCA